MAKIDELLEKYGESHQNKINKAIHWIAVPSIVFSLLALIWSIPTPDIFPFSTYFNWASIVIAAALYYYYRLSPTLAFAMLLVVFGMSYLIVQLEQTEYALWVWALWIFVIAWVFQFIGHKIEGKKPSFLEDVQFLLIGPVWLLHFIFKKLGLKY